jgi:hypothetical protein
VLPTVPARLPLTVLLNGQAEEPAPSAADQGEVMGFFTFDREPCEGLVVVRQLSGALDDGLGGAHSTYGGAPRNCSWLLKPAVPPSHAGNYSLVLSISELGLRSGIDSFSVSDGVDGAELLIDRPGGADESIGHSGCKNASGTCMETVVVKSGVALVALTSMPRTDGTSSHFAMTYTTVRSLSDSVDSSYRAAVTRDVSGEIHDLPLQARRAAEWRLPGMDGSEWPGDPSQWGHTGERSKELDITAAYDSKHSEGNSGTAEYAAEGTARADPSGICHESDACPG